MLIDRDWYQLGAWRLTGNGRCVNCDTPLAGVFDGPPGTWGPRRLPVLIANQLLRPLSERLRRPAGTYSLPDIFCPGRVVSACRMNSDHPILCAMPFTWLPWQHIPGSVWRRGHCGGFDEFPEFGAEAGGGGAVHDVVVDGQGEIQDVPDSTWPLTARGRWVIPPTITSSDIMVRGVRPKPPPPANMPTAVTATVPTRCRAATDRAITAYIAGIVPGIRVAAGAARSSHLPLQLAEGSRLTR